MNSDAPRRSPQRPRGKQRVTLILDTAEMLLAEEGYEALTTNAIAAKASIPIGSVYQFFPNKEAILSAIGERYREGIQLAYGGIITLAKRGVSLEALVNAWVDTITDFGGAHFGFTRIVLGASTVPSLAEALIALNQEVVRQVMDLLGVIAPATHESQREISTHVCLTILHSLLGLAIQQKIQHTSELGMARMWQFVSETKVVLGAYLAEFYRNAARSEH
ncbi:MAG: TetR/AcrR family transcriptional regulator [Anaerolineae bacterium]